MSSRNTCHQILIAAGRPGLAAVDERGVLLQELFAVGWDICGSFTRPQNAVRRRSQISSITLQILAPGKPGIFQSQRFAHGDDQVQIPRA